MWPKKTSTNSDEADDDDGKGRLQGADQEAEELKKQALERFDKLRELFEKIHKIYDKEGYGTLPT